MAKVAAPPRSHGGSGTRNASGKSGLKKPLATLQTQDHVGFLVFSLHHVDCPAKERPTTNKFFRNGGANHLLIFGKVLHRRVLQTTGLLTVIVGEVQKHGITHLKELSGLLTVIVGEVQKTREFIVSASFGLLTVIVGEVQKLGRCGHLHSYGLLTVIVGEVQKLNAW